jgi:1-acyl-sn-glycerol-3-phosphate acyltransferase
MLNKIRMAFSMMQLITTVSVVIILMYLFKSKNRTIRKAWGKIQMKLLGINLEIEGEVDNQANMIVMNHQSLLDIIMLEYLHPKNISWVAKKEIANLPWFGHILKVPDMIIVERENKASLVKLLKDSKEKYDQDRPIAIFPEGTRTDGKKLRKFKAGAKMIAQKYNFKVQPIVIVGTRDILDSHNFTQKSGTVKIIYLPTIQADKQTTWYEDMATNMATVLDNNIGIKKNES